MALRLAASLAAALIVCEVFLVIPALSLTSSVHPKNDPHHKPAPRAGRSVGAPREVHHHTPAPAPRAGRSVDALSEVHHHVPAPAPRTGRSVGALREVHHHTPAPAPRAGRSVDALREVHHHTPAPGPRAGRSVDALSQVHPKNDPHHKPAPRTGRSVGALSEVHHHTPAPAPRAGRSVGALREVHHHTPAPAPRAGRSVDALSEVHHKNDPHHAPAPRTGRSVGAVSGVHHAQHLPHPRARRSADKEFMCLIPINVQANEPYIRCGVINDTQSEYAMPVELGDGYTPQFEYAVLCANASQEDSDSASASEDSSTESSTENSTESGEDSGEDSQEDSGEQLCLRGEYEDCSVQCVYEASHLLNADGLPEADLLYDHLMALVDHDAAFRAPVKEAVRVCHKRLVVAVDKFGLENMHMCLLLEIVDECLELEVGTRCPKEKRIPFKKS